MPWISVHNSTLQLLEVTLRVCSSESTHGIPGRECDGVHGVHLQHLFWHILFVHHNLKHKLPEPTRSHDEVTLFSSVFSPAILDSPLLCFSRALWGIQIQNKPMKFRSHSRIVTVPNFWHYKFQIYITTVWDSNHFLNEKVLLNKFFYTVLYSTVFWLD